MNFKRTLLYEHLHESEFPKFVDDSGLDILDYLMSLLVMLIAGPFAYAWVIISSPIYFILYIIKDIYDRTEDYRERKRYEKLQEAKKAHLIHINEYINNYQERLDLNERPLYFRGYRHNRNLALYTFIKEHFFELNNNHVTMNGRRIQCERQRRRSLYDIYLICKFYYPDCTAEGILKMLIHLYNEKEICISKCFQIGRYTFYPGIVSDYVNLNNDVEFIEEFSCTMKDIINNIK